MIRVGDGCRYYRDGWRYGIIREAPTKGRRKQFVRVENPTALYSRDGGVRRRLEWVAREDLDTNYAPR